MARWVKPPFNPSAPTPTLQIPAWEGEVSPAHPIPLSAPPCRAHLPPTLCGAGRSGFTLPLQEFFLPHLLAVVAFDFVLSLGSQGDAVRGGKGK